MHQVNSAKYVCVFSSLIYVYALKKNINISVFGMGWNIKFDEPF